MTSLLHRASTCCALMRRAIIDAKVVCNDSFFLPFGLVISRGAKHWNPKFRKLRSLKMIKVDLLDFQDLSRPPEELSKEEIKSRMKEKGILPERPWVEKPVYISSTASVFEPYVPPEGDGKVSAITAQGAKQKLEFIQKKSKSMLAVRKIRNFEEEFEFPDFLKEAQEIYINSHLAMMKYGIELLFKWYYNSVPQRKDRDELIQYVTERAYPEVVSNIGDKTIHWEFLQSLEPPRVVHVRCTDVITKENIFSQITVRFHTQQKLVIYDRFGRLLHGSTSLPKDVLEYVVFEKHISNKYGRWRVHEKIIPNWMPPREPSLRTQVLPSEPTVSDDTLASSQATTAAPVVEANTTKSSQPVTA